MPRSLAIADAGTRAQACGDAAAADDATPPIIASAVNATQEPIPDQSLIRSTRYLVDLTLWAARRFSVDRSSATPFRPAWL